MVIVMGNISQAESETNFLIKLSTGEVSHGVLIDKLACIIQWITYSTLCQAVNIFGVGSNIINIICFVKQGFKDPVNVSFLGLAVADIGCLITIMWTSLCFSPAFVELDLPFDSIEFQYLTAGMPHTTFTRITSWITALITLERCLCITAPIKVKTIVTPKRVTIIIIVIFLVLIASTAPIYVVNRLGMKFYPDRNKTLIGIVSMGNKEVVEKVVYIINVCIPFIAFMIIIICTILLAIKLRRKTKWRQKSSISLKSDTISLRNQNVSKMVVIISILFISCFTSVCVVVIAVSLEPELSIGGKYINVGLIVVGIGALLESINSSVNIFVYYNMSSKYKITFRHLFNLDSKS